MDHSTRCTERKADEAAERLQATKSKSQQQKRAAADLRAKLDAVSVLRIDVGVVLTGGYCRRPTISWLLRSVLARCEMSSRGPRLRFVI